MKTIFRGSEAIRPMVAFQTRLASRLRKLPRATRMRRIASAAAPKNARQSAYRELEPRFMHEGVGWACVRALAGHLRANNWRSSNEPARKPAGAASVAAVF
jgi:hypothetical protein